MVRFEGDMKKAKEGLRNLLGHEANMLLDNARAPIEEIGAEVDRFIDLLEFAKKYVDTSEYENVPTQVMDRRGRSMEVIL